MHFCHTFKMRIAALRACLESSHMSVVTKNDDIQEEARRA
jgi:hypothetical protein